MGPPLRQPGRMTSSTRLPSKSPSPDPELVRFLNEQKRPCSPESEAFRNKRIAAGGALNRKSKYQREKEESERKKLDEEQRAAKAYQELIQDMEGTHSGGSNFEKRSGFVRGGSSSTYEPNARLHPLASSSKFISSQVMNENYSADDDDLTAVSVKRDGSGKRKGAMGSFLGELQRDQAQREERLRYQVAEGNSISSLLAHETGGGNNSSGKPNDAVDGASSNVCVLNLPLGITEAMFGSYFAKYGDVASVKIMWPRSTDDLVHPSLRSTRSAGATGFVNFMYRGDAERAVREIEGSEWLGCMLRTGWSKAVRKPVQPLYTRSNHQRDTADGTNKDSSRHDNRTRSSRSPGTRKHRRVRERSLSLKTNLQNAVQKAKGEDAVEKIQLAADLVKKFGSSYEKMLREKEAGNPLYDFLQPGDSTEYNFYQILLDDQYVASLPAASSFEDDGEASLYSSDSEEDSEWEKLRSKERTKELGKAARRRLEAMLRGMTLRRERIARAMVFAIDHAVAAEAVSNVIIESLLQPATPLPRKLARLYTVSDILHNSSVSASNAWRYRSLFEDKLDVVFMHWGDVANSFSGRIKRESCKEMARHIVQIWENWLIYEGAKLATWKQHIESGSTASMVKQEEKNESSVL